MLVYPVLNPFIAGKPLLQKAWTLVYVVILFSFVNIVTAHVQRTELTRVL